MDGVSQDDGGWRRLFCWFGRKKRAQDDSLVQYQLKELVAFGSGPLPAQLTLAAVGNLYKALRADPIWLWAAFSDLKTRGPALQQQPKQQLRRVATSGNSLDDALNQYVSLVGTTTSSPAATQEASNLRPPVQGKAAGAVVLSEDEALLAFSNLRVGA